MDNTIKQSRGFKTNLNVANSSVKIHSDGLLGRLCDKIGRKVNTVIKIRINSDSPQIISISKKNFTKL